MKRRISFILVLVLPAVCGMAIRAGLLRARYPDPEILTCEYGDSVQTGGYSITFDGWQWGDESLIGDRFPDYHLIYEEEPEGGEEARVGLIELTIRRSEEEAEPLDLTRFAFSSESWGNQFDMELFYLLNPGGGSLMIDLPEGEMTTLCFPMVMLESNFTADQWKEIDRRTFYLNVRFYPEHIRFALPGGK